MRNKSLVFVMMTVCLSFLLAAREITVTSPNGGESWVRGEIRNITWTAFGITAGTFQVTVWKGGSSQGVIATGLPVSQRSFNWIVGRLATGAEVAAGSGYTIKVRLQGEETNDFSDAPFTITAAGTLQTITVTRPAGGENWSLGDSQAINWNTSGISSGTYQVSVWKGDSSLGVIATGLPASSPSFNWTVGRLAAGDFIPAGSGYTIKVRLQEEVAHGFSGAFSIAPSLTQGIVVTGRPARARPTVKAKKTEPGFKFLMPVSGISWKLGETEELRWESSNIGSAEIHLILYKLVGAHKRSVGFIAKNLRRSPREAFSWEVGRFSDGRSLDEGGQFQVMIADKGGTVTRFSDTFEIQQKRLDLRCHIRNFRIRTVHNFDILSQGINMILPGWALMEGVHVVHAVEFDLLLGNAGEWPAGSMNVEWKWEIRSFAVKDGSLVASSERVDLSRSGSTEIHQHVGEGGGEPGYTGFHVKAGVPCRSSKMRIIVKAEVDPHNHLSSASVLKRDAEVRTVTLIVD